MADTQNVIQVILQVLTAQVKNAWVDITFFPLVIGSTHHCVLG